MSPEYSEYPEYEIQKIRDQPYPLDSLEGMDPNSNLPPAGFKEEFVTDKRAGAEVEPEESRVNKGSKQVRVAALVIFSLFIIPLAIYGIILRQRAVEIENSRKDLKSSLEKLNLSLAAISNDLAALNTKSESDGPSLIDRLTNLEKTSFLGKTEAIRATQILGSINEILKRPAAAINAASTSNAFDQARIFTLNAENYTSEAYKTFSYFNLTYSTDTGLANLSVTLSEIINEALTGNDPDPAKFKEITDTLQKVKDALMEAGKDLPYALGTVAEKNNQLVDGFTAAVKSTKDAVDTGDRLTLSTIIGTTGEKLNALWQSRGIDEQAFWETNRTLKRYLYLKTDTDKILKLL